MYSSFPLLSWTNFWQCTLFNLKSVLNWVTKYIVISVTKSELKKVAEFFPFILPTWSFADREGRWISRRAGERYLTLPIVWALWCIKYFKERQGWTRELVACSRLCLCLSRLDGKWPWSHTTLVWHLSCAGESVWKIEKKELLLITWYALCQSFTVDWVFCIHYLIQFSEQLSEVEMFVLGLRMRKLRFSQVRQISNGHVH